MPFDFFSLADTRKKMEEYHINYPDAQMFKSMPQLARYCCAFLFLLLFVVTSPVFGKDFGVLIRVLYAAFLAEDGSAMCLVPSITLPEGDRIVFIDAINYARWIKQRVGAGL